MLHFLIAGAIAMAVPQQTDTTLSVRPGGRLEVDNYAGAVTVRSWNRSEVRVQATHSSRADVEIEQRGNTVSIDASGEHGPVSVRYTITVPKSFRISVDGVDTDVDVQGIDGDINVETVEGDVTIRTVTGRVQAESVSGYVTVDGVKGAVQVSATNESVRVSNVTGDLQVEAVNGGISMMNIVASRVEAETVNGSIMLGSTVEDGGAYSLSTTNGTITMAIPERTNASLEISTYSGKLDTTLPLTMDRRRSGGSYSFSIGTGSARIEIDAFSGNVRLVRPNELRDTLPERKKK
jgi:DUF4097 and DUF4098 domain-containing protein YvlB